MEQPSKSKFASIREQFNQWNNEGIRRIGYVVGVLVFVASAAIGILDVFEQWSGLSRHREELREYEEIRGQITTRTRLQKLERLISSKKEWVDKYTNRLLSSLLWVAVFPALFGLGGLALVRGGDWIIAGFAEKR